MGVLVASELVFWAARRVSRAVAGLSVLRVCLSYALSYRMSG